MFQSFDATSSPETGADRLHSLRQEIEKEGLTGFLIPRADAHQGEYVAPCDERLSYLTGFTGSAGFAAVLPEIAGVFIDGRYRVQVKQQVDLAHFTPVHWPEIKLHQWLNDHSSPVDIIGFDPWLHTIAEVDSLQSSLTSGAILREVPNLVDRIWADRPAQPDGKITAHPLELSGKSSADKRAEIATSLSEANHTAAILTLPDSIAWLLNIRGSDIARIPIARAFAILFADGTVTLFTDPTKLSDLAREPGLTIAPPEAFPAALAALTGTIRLDPKTAAHAVKTHLTAEIAPDGDPCVLPKARKNRTEIEGARTAHLRDGAAMVEFLTWFDQQPPGTVTEIDAVTALEAKRAATNALRDISFDTISGAGPNGAVIHYRVTHETNRTAQSGDLLVLDSGGQYIDGTTDITRTLPIGPPSDIQKRCFTRVLQGMIAISRARFPRGLAGRDLDSLARFPLWCDGLDYDHGTGHGVGSYLSVHEGPQRISRIAEVALDPGMILSNEPGYYREGAFGIRIENLIVVTPAEPIKGADARDMMSFETLTYVPIDRRLIETTLLSPEEIQWLNAYHAETHAKLHARLTPEARDWLDQACAPL